MACTSGKIVELSDLPVGVAFRRMDMSHITGLKRADFYVCVCVCMRCLCRSLTGRLEACQCVLSLHEAEAKVVDQPLHAFHTSRVVD